MKNFVCFLWLSCFLFACRKEATSWNSKWIVPLFQDTLDLKNLTNDSTLTIQNGSYFLDLTRQIASIKPSEYVKIPDTLIEQKFAISISSLNIPPGTSFVNNNEDHIFDLEDTQLKKARIKQGKIFFEVFNPLATKTFFEIELPSVTFENQVIKKTLEVPSGSFQNPGFNQLEIDLSAYYVDLTGSNGSSFNALPSKLKVSTDPAGDYVVLKSTDSTKFKIKMEDIVLDYARGYFGTYKVSDSYSFVSEFLQKNVKGSVDLPKTHLDVIFENGIKVSSKASVEKLANMNSENESTILLNHPMIGNPFTIQSATGSWENLSISQKTFTFDENNSNIEQFVENLGETTNIDYELELNPWGNISGGWDEFFPNSSLDVFLKAQMPLNIGLNNFILSNTFDVNFNQDYQKTHINSGTLYVKLENAFPIEGQLELAFLDEFDQVIFTIANSDKIKSAVYGTLNAFGILSSKSNLEIVFPESLLSRLNEIKKMSASIKLNTPNAQTNQSEQISIPEHAFCKIKVQTSFNLENRIEQ